MATESYHPSIYTPDLQENRLPGQEAPAGLVTPELALSAKLILDTATTLNTSEFQERFKADPSLRAFTRWRRRSLIWSWITPQCF